MYRPIIPFRIILLILLALTTSGRVALAEDLPIVVEARTLLETIERLAEEYRELEAESKSALESDGKAVAELQARRRLVEWMRTVESLVANVAEQQEQGLDESRFLRETRKLLWSLDRRLSTFIDEITAENAGLRGTLGEASAESVIVIESAGVVGTVDRMNLVSTTILTFDIQTLIVPNSRIWGNVIRNATAMDRRRVDLSFPLALDVDVEQAEALFASICRAHPAFPADPELATKVNEITGGGVLFVVRPWVRTEDCWPTYWDLNREAHVQLAEAGIQIAAARYKLEDQDSARSK